MKRTISGEKNDSTLLERLIAALQRGQVRSLSSLAAELGTSPGLVAAMLEELGRRGYLREVPAACCAGSCQGCPLGKTCAAGEMGRTWAWSDPAGRQESPPADPEGPDSGPSAGPSSSSTLTAPQ